MNYKAGKITVPLGRIDSYVESLVQIVKQTSRPDCFLLKKTTGTNTRLFTRFFAIAKF